MQAPAFFNDLTALTLINNWNGFFFFFFLDNRNLCHLINVVARADGRWAVFCSYLAVILRDWAMVAVWIDPFHGSLLRLFTVIAGF